VLDVVFSSGLLRLIGVFLMALLGDLEAGKRGVAWRLPEEFGRCVACQMAEGSRVDRWHWRGGLFRSVLRRLCSRVTEDWSRCCRGDNKEG
jgi:hypothetical protein